MQTISVLTLLSISLHLGSLASADLLISSSTFGLRHLVEEGKYSLCINFYILFSSPGSGVLLSCPSPRPWLLCVMVSPMKEVVCGVREGGSIARVCQGASLSLTGDETRCEVRIQAAPSHHGVWTCMLTMDQDYQAITTYIHLEVAVRPQVSIRHTAHGLVGWEDQQGAGRAVHLVEGEEQNFTCLAEEGFPRPDIHWTLGNYSTMTMVQGNSKVRWRDCVPLYVIHSLQFRPLSSCPPPPT